MSEAAAGRPGESYVPPDELLELGLAAASTQYDHASGEPLLRKLASDGLAIAQKAAINPESARFLNMDLDFLAPCLNQFRIGFNDYVRYKAGIEMIPREQARRKINGCNTATAALLNCNTISDAWMIIGPEALAYNLDYVTALYQDEVRLQRVLRFLRLHDSFKGLLDDSNSVWPQAVGIADDPNKSDAFAHATQAKKAEGRDFCLGYYAPIIAVAKYTGALSDDLELENSETVYTPASLGILRPDTDVRPSILSPDLTQLRQAVSIKQSHNTLGIDIKAAAKAVNDNPESAIKERLQTSAPGLNEVRDHVLQWFGAEYTENRTKEEGHLVDGFDTIALALAESGNEALQATFRSLGGLSLKSHRKDIAEAIQHTNEAVSAAANAQKDPRLIRQYFRLSKFPLLDSISKGFENNASDYAKAGYDAERQDAKKLAYRKGAYILLLTLFYLLESERPAQQEGAA